MSISVALAVHNEEKNIIRCLESIYDWVDEIVIVDGASTDNTVKLIKKQDPKNKIQTINAKNEKMFHINKQKALDACTGDWILQLDADEIVSPELKKEIQSVILTRRRRGKDLNRKAEIKKRSVESDSTLLDSSPMAQNDKIVAYWLPRLNYFLGKPLRKGGQYPDYTIRLYRNGIAKFPCKDVHENVIINSEFKIQNSKFQTNNKEIGNWKLEIGYLKSPLLHFPYPTFGEYLNKWDRYCKLEADKMKKKGIKPGPWLFTKYIFLMPPYWFFKTYFRHLGFLDGKAGFVFSYFSSLRYIKIFTYLLDK